MENPARKHPLLKIQDTKFQQWNNWMSASQLWTWSKWSPLVKTTWRFKGTRVKLTFPLNTIKQTFSRHVMGWRPPDRPQIREPFMTTKSKYNLHTDKFGVESYILPQREPDDWTSPIDVITCSHPFLKDTFAIILCLYHCFCDLSLSWVDLSWVTFSHDKELNVRKGR